MQTTGAADLLARFLVGTIAQGNPIAALAVSDHHVPVGRDEQRRHCGHPVSIALGIAATLGVNPTVSDVAIGASCAFSRQSDIRTTPGILARWLPVITGGWDSWRGHRGRRQSAAAVADRLAL
jgi:hypothetical protein